MFLLDSRDITNNGPTLLFYLCVSLSCEILKTTANLNLFSCALAIYHCQNNNLAICYITIFPADFASEAVFFMNQNACYHELGLSVICFGLFWCIYIKSSV